MSVGLRLQFDGGASLGRLNLQLQRLSDVSLAGMLDSIGSEVTAQTKRRIGKDKKAPDGSKWDDWSPEYAASQHARTSRHDPHPGALRSTPGHTLLQLDGGLLTSIQFDVQGNAVLVGSPEDYARAMNAQRQYLGLGTQDVDDVEALVVEFFREVIVK